MKNKFLIVLIILIFLGILAFLGYNLYAAINSVPRAEETNIIGNGTSTYVYPTKNLVI